MPPKRTRLDRFLARLLERLKILDGCTYHSLRITRRAAIVLVALMSLIKFGPSKLGTTANKPSEQLPDMAYDNFESYTLIGGEGGGIIGGEAGDIVLNGGTGWGGAWVVRANAK